jgi:hypothetical protein
MAITSVVATRCCVHVQVQRCSELERALQERLLTQHPLQGSDVRHALRAVSSLMQPSHSRAILVQQHAGVEPHAGWRDWCSRNAPVVTSALSGLHAEVTACS